MDRQREEGREGMTKRATNRGSWEERLLTVTEVTKLLRCHFRTVHRLIHQGQLRAVKVGRGFRITRQDYEAYLRTHGTKPSSEEDRMEGANGRG